MELNRTARGLGLVLPVIVAGVWLAACERGSDSELPAIRYDRTASGRVERVRSGHKIKLAHGVTVKYAAIRTPYGNEPLHDEATERNRELVKGKTVRLRFDEVRTDRKDDVIAYVFCDDVFVNLRLIEEGLGVVRLTPGINRYNQELLDAQDEARRTRLGVWKYYGKSRDKEYQGDGKHGTLHRMTCEDVPNTRAEYAVMFESASEGLERGFAPCAKCRP